MAIIFRDIMILLGYINYFLLLSTPGNTTSSLTKTANMFAFSVWMLATWLDIISISKED